MQIGSFWRGASVPSLISTKNATSNGGVSNPRVPPASGAEAVDELILSVESGEVPGLPVMSDLTATRFHKWSTAPGDQLRDIQVNYEERVARFQSLFSSQLQDRNIDTDQTIQLSIDALGYVKVNGSHSQAAEIEQIFRDNPEYRNLFAEISAGASLKRAAKEAAEFQKAYLEDPLQALRDFRHLFDRNRAPQYSMIMTNGILTESFS